VAPDGISTQDWDTVHELALEIANSSSRGDSPASKGATAQLLSFLDVLEGRYGSLPSILGTRADYVAMHGERGRWLLAVYREAERRSDRRNLAWLAASLAGFYIEQRPRVSEGLRWLRLLEGHVQACPEAGERKEYERLKARVGEQRLAADGRHHAKE
jgi:hypothetical protein